MIVMKFGGTSVADCAAISRTIEIIRKRLPERPVVVVSALSKVTDLLYRISDEAKKRNFEEASALLRQLRSRHLTLAEELISQSESIDKESILEDTQRRVNEICDKLSHSPPAFRHRRVPQREPREKWTLL